MIYDYLDGNMDDLLVKNLKRAIFEATQSKAINRKIGACLIPEYSEVPIGAYNGPPRGIQEVDNWDRFDDETYNRIWKLADDKHGVQEKPTPTNVPEGIYYVVGTHEQIFLKNPRSLAHDGVDYDPRYLLGYTSGNGLKYMIDSHAERNVIFNAARSGIRTVGSSLYLTCNIPCKECTIAILQAGIEYVFALKSSDGTNEDTNDSEYAFRLSRWLFSKSKTTHLIEYPAKYLEEARNG